MLYRPPAHLRMWDTWMFREGSRFHLFFLTSRYEKPLSPNTLPWDRVCHVVSADWLHWEERPEIILQENELPDAWDAGCILTGSTFRTEAGYAMAYGAVHQGVQKIGLLLSRDLDQWHKHLRNPVLCPCGPWYESARKETDESSVPWRDAYVVPDSEGYEAFICAGDLNMPKTVNGCIARATSPDLINWTCHPPMVSPGRYIDMEVPQYLEWNGFHYLLFSTGGNVRRIHLPSRQRVSGTFYLVSNTKYGPYRVPEDNLLIGSGEGRFDCYVGKIIMTDGAPLLYHHIGGYRTAFAAPKVVQQSPDGLLRLERWPGLDGLLGAVKVSGAAALGYRLMADKRWPIGDWRYRDGAWVGDAGVAASGWMFAEEMWDFSCRSRLDLSRCARAGALFRIHDCDTSSEKGWAVSLDREHNRIELCRPITQNRTALRLDPLDVVHGAVPESCLLEIFMRDSYLEVYVNQQPLFMVNTSLVTATDHVTSGRVGIFVENGTAGFHELSLREIPVPLK